MAYLQIENQDGHAGASLRLVPGGEYRAASRATLWIGIVICVVAAIIALQDWFGALVCMYIGMTFLLTAMMLHGRQRIIEFDQVEKVISIFGGQQSDMMMFYFKDVEKLRLEPENMARLGEQGTAVRAKSARRWHLDLHMYDGTCIGLERSVAYREMANFGRLLAEYVDVAFENVADDTVIQPQKVDGQAGGISGGLDHRSATEEGVGAQSIYMMGTPSSYSHLVALCNGHDVHDVHDSHDVHDVHDSHDVHDVHDSHDVYDSQNGINGWQWPLLWRAGALFPLLLVTVSLAVASTFSLWYMLMYGVSFAGLILLVIAAFFLQIAVVNVWNILFGHAFCVVEDGRLRHGTKIFWWRRITWDVALADVRKVFVHMPVKGRVRLYCTMSDGRRLQLMKLTPGITVVTGGDAFWLATWLRRQMMLEK
ncbi:MAG: hypothetical protein R3Y11_02270 [Pseudomonadota bacterium]